MKSRRLLAWLLVLFMAVQVPCVGVSAQELDYTVRNSTEGSRKEEDTAAETASEEMQIVSEDSFGSFIADTLEKSNEKSQESGFRIAEIEVEGQTASVRYQAEEECDLVVAVYSEDGTQMFGSGSEKAVPGKNTMQVQLAVNELPEFYLIKAYLLDRDEHHALCETYIDDEHTQEFQEFLAKTVDDPSFEGKEILNLDEDRQNNFAVFAPGTIVVKEGGGVLVEDHKDGTYTISNPSEAVRGLAQGDTFVYQYEDGRVLIIVVSEVTDQDGAIVVTDNPKADLEDVFEYVKIGGTSGQAELDDSTLSSGITRNPTAGLRSQEEKGTPVEYQFSAELKALFSAEASVEVNLYKGRTTAEAKVTGTITVDGKLDASMSADKEFKSFSKYAISPVPGVFVTFVPGVRFEASGEITLNTTLTSTMGFGYDTDREGGFYDLTTGPAMDGELDTEIEVYVGLKLTPEILVLNEKVTRMSMPVEIGGTIHVKSENKFTNDVYKHECKLCYAGDIKASGSIGGTIAVLNKESLSKSWEIGPVKVCDFYWSVDKNEHGKGRCPYISYKTVLKAVDENGEAVENARLTVKRQDKQEKDTEYTTPRDGSVTLYLVPGKYMVIFRKGSLLATQSLTVADDKQEHTVVMEDKGCGEDLYWSLDDGGTLSIIGTGPMFDWTFNEKAPWAKERKKIKALYISEGVTYLGNYAFYDCAGGKNELKLPETLTAIGDYTFASDGIGSDKGFRFTGEFVIPENVTSIGSYAFRSSGYLNYYDAAENVTKVTLGNKLTKLGEGAFTGFGCQCELVLPDSLEQIPESAFSGSGFTGLTLGKNVKFIGEGAFKRCHDMKGDLIIPDQVVTIEREAFTECGDFEGRLIIGKSVETIGNYAFGSHDAPGVWKGKFTGELVIPDSVKTIGAGAFEECGSLTGVTLGKNLEVIGGSAFGKCASMTNHLIIPDSVQRIGEKAFVNCDFSALTLGKGLKRIEGWAFSNCKNMKGELVFPDGLEVLGGFSGCSSLTGSVIIPDSVTEIIDYAFSECSGLDGTLSLPAGLVKIGKYAFNRCSALAGALNIPAGVTEIGEYAFYGCSGLAADNLVLPEGIKELDYMSFYGCTGLTGELVMPSGVTLIDNAAFMGCTGLTSVTFNTGLKTIWYRAFKDCTGLTRITFPGKAPELNSGAFEGAACTAYYPSGDSTWKETVMQKAGPDLTWTPYDAASGRVLKDAEEAEDADDGGAAQRTAGDDITIEPQSEAGDSIESGAREKAGDGMRSETKENAGDSDADITKEKKEEKETEGADQDDGEDGTKEEVIVDTQEAEAFQGQPEEAERKYVREDTEGILDVENQTQKRETAVGGSFSVNEGKLTAEFMDLNPESTYIVLAVKRGDAVNLVDHENLLYISQEKADASGKLSITCTPAAVTGAMSVKVYGEVNWDLKNSTVKLSKTSYIYSGEAFKPGVTVQYAGKTLTQNQDYTVSYADNVNAGTAKVVVDGKNSYKGSQVKEFTINKAEQTITCPYSYKEIKAGESAAIGAKASGALSFRSSDSSIAAVNAKGVVTGKKAGSATITINAKETVNYKAKTRTVTFKVSADPVKGNTVKKPVKVSRISVSGISKRIAAGKKIKLNVKVLPAGAKNKAVTWSSSNKKYASVNSKGVVTMKKAGKGKTVTITAKAKDGSGKKASIKIKIMKGAVKKIKLNAVKSVKAGRKVKIKAKVTAAKGANKTLAYTVNSKKYASVNKKGVVTTKKAGKGKRITVTAKATDGSGKKAVVKIRLR